MFDSLQIYAMPIYMQESRQRVNERSTRQLRPETGLCLYQTEPRFYGLADKTHQVGAITDFSANTMDMASRHAGKSGGARDFTPQPGVKLCLTKMALVADE